MNDNSYTVVEHVIETATPMTPFALFLPLVYFALVLRLVDFERSEILKQVPVLEETSFNEASCRNLGGSASCEMGCLSVIIYRVNS